jgi:hypothetical protein
MAALATILKAVVDTEATWPECASLKLNSLGDVNLRDLSNELRVVVQSAIHKITSWIIFKDSFPTLAVRGQWNQDALEEAVQEFMDCSRDPLRAKYRAIWERVNQDPNFVKILGRVVCCSSLPVSVLKPFISQMQELVYSVALSSRRAYHSSFNFTTSRMVAPTP